LEAADAHLLKHIEDEDTEQKLKTYNSAEKDAH
jgi:hypothetical protein